MSKVKRLPEDLANKIAAGEVIERPASVVKELVENAIDAGATRVRVDIAEGGLARIAVTDDGDGMTVEDALLALERHATSKLRAFEDLLHLTSFGFRGEALPSIASVSKLTILTRTRHKSEGTSVQTDGAGRPTAKPAGIAPGTTVEVADLFYNVPARRKFLKSTATESAHIGEIVLAAALSRPEITFELHRDGKLARAFARAKDRAERAGDAHAGDPLFAITVARGDVKLEAFLGRPERARAGAQALHLVVNGRVVRDRALARAVAQAYGSVLESGRYPIGALYIDLPTELVDVNVHPQKSEVRFATGRALYDQVARDLNAKLAALLSLPQAGVFSPWARARPAGTDPSNEPVGRMFRSPPFGVATTTQKSAELREAQQMALAVAAARAQTVSDDGEPITTRESALPPALISGPDFYESLHFLAQTRAMYLLCEGPDALYVIDQHAAAERVTFDRLRRQYLARAIAIQKLLIPEVLSVTPDEAELVEMHADAITALGVELVRTGPTSVSVAGTPRILRSSPERIARDVLSELSRKSANAFSGAVDLVLATMACHGSVRAGDAMDRAEAEALLEALREVDFSGHCPHGRPIVVTLSWEELARRVGR